VSRTTKNIIAIVLLIVFLPAILLAIFVHPLFLLLLLIMAFLVPFLRAIRG
jgi:hypothetical protein